jgi:hypothetical protein
MSERPTLTLQDVAALARVSRPVVSMWRRRPQVRGQLIPFPQAVAMVGGFERFDRDEIVGWLEKTGRGNNVEARQDARALSVPEGIEGEEVVTLLCLQAMTGAEMEGLGPDELVSLAAGVDPRDGILLREVRALRTDQKLLRYVDDLVEASYGVSDALARLEAGRLRRESGERGLTDELVGLLRTITVAARAHLGDEAVALALPADHRLARRLAEGFDGVLVDRTDDSARRQRRRAMIGGFDVLDDVQGAVRVVSVVGESDADVLEVVDELVLSLGPGDIGIVLGSAAVLCDQLIGESEQRRSQTLRAGNLAMAMRLPRGHWKAAHRQSLGLWILQGGRNEQSLRMADLTAETIDADDLASDVSAALQFTEDRAYRYARRGELALVLAGGPVVPRGVRAVRLGSTGTTTHLDNIHTATLTTSEPVPGYDVTVAPALGQIVLRQRSLGELVAVGQLVMRRGSRIDTTQTDPAGTVSVTSADGSTDHVHLDPFDAARLYPRATRTEPGDVIFLQRPRPTARVDRQGGALVASPSRILRLQPGAFIGPHSLAAIINMVATPGSDWQTWSVPEFDPREADALDAALAGAADHLADLYGHVQATRDLTTSLIQGAATGAVTIDSINIKRAG